MAQPSFGAQNQSMQPQGNNYMTSSGSGSNTGTYIQSNFQMHDKQEEH
jgi:hypothetical protein